MSSPQDHKLGKDDGHEATTRTMSSSPSKDIKKGGDLGLETSSQTTDSIVPVPEGVNDKKLMRKIDFKLIPWLSLLYLLSFLDRSAIGNAKLYGMREELNMTPTEFNLATAVFFFPYAAFEVPSNILLKRLRPSVWFPLITVLVGICMMAQGLVTNYSGLLAVRFLLGMTEAGLFPGANYLLSGWYKRSEFGLRASIFFSAATASGAFGGLLSAAIHNMEGVGNYSGWRWIFILIGLATVVAGVMSIWLCVDFPDTAKFLSDDERAFVINRLQADQKFSAAGEGFQWSNVIKAVLDWKSWVGMLAYMGVDGPLYAFSIFTPSIVQQLGYSSTRANLISVPIYVFACIVTVGVGFFADRKGNRGFINMAMIAIGITGYIILAASRTPGLSYFAIYLAAAGIYPCIPNTIAMTSTTIEGAYKRSVVMAWIISFGNINGAATTQVYLQKDAPWYTMGHGIIIMYLTIGFLATLIYNLGLRRSNARKSKGLCDETILSDQDEATPELRQQAAAENEKLIANEKGLFGLRALRRRYGESDGGVYATVQDAKAHKGDNYSGFRYSY